ncbi:hypothetical protein Leucomu_11565 [Leucobacter muris]|jgi:hypothetical protein|uniref:Integral membrane protein n=1 Tax=Leucobacter muris TaxID=1935379 RepID=A0ABX5QHA0_9MICO|nr:hypothetical protein [Leucobacter muris]QAB18467.1 hypothetical protein Leucomu_11565 [Leucobacter muris]
MILWYAVVTIVVALAGASLCLIAALRKRGPDDFTMGATLLVALLLLVQIVISIVAPFTGNSATGDPLEFWMYLVVAFLLPPGAGFWALVDRTRWANLVLSVVHLAVAVMVYRMLVIWG